MDGQGARRAEGSVDAPPRAPDAGPPPIDAGALGPAVGALGPGRRLVLLGAERRRATAWLRAGAGPARPLLLLGAGDGRGAGALVDALLDDLAALALRAWPRWPEQGAADGPWRRAAARLAGAGRAPRLRRAGPGAEFAALSRAAVPGGLVVVAEVDPASPARARASVEAVEWCQARGAPVLALLPFPPAPEPPYDRLLYGARALREPPEPLDERFIAAPGRPHPASDTERRVRAALDADAELGPLFRCNRAVALAGATAPRVDLLWQDGRVVVELDGPEHRAEPKFSEDRHRDHELMLAGYRVLRITNGQVAADLARAVEKIRAVVRLSRSEGRRP